MIFGPMVIQVAVPLILSGFLTFISLVPFTIGTYFYLHERLSADSHFSKHFWAHMMTHAVISAFLTIICFIWLVLTFSCVFYATLPSALNDIVWKYPFLCRRWRNSVRKVYWMLFWDYRAWKSEKINSFHSTMSWLLHVSLNVVSVCVESWERLSALQKLVSDIGHYLPRR
ncbi:hypothetical protein C8R43DRAFT_978650 [Mycena crocata]|nr:hypothetical protein C8R43DRAFT_978650 [Mycena crocata]